MTRKLRAIDRQPISRFEYEDGFVIDYLAYPNRFMLARVDCRCDQVAKLARPHLHPEGSFLSLQSAERVLGKLREVTCTPS